MPGNNLAAFDDILRRSMQPRATDLGVFDLQIDNALHRIRVGAILQNCLGWREDLAWTDFGSACVWTDVWVKMWGAVAAAHERRVFGTGELW